jgi:HicB_like antitoxin of bacterial toxin-antitoxin system
MGGSLPVRVGRMTTTAIGNTVYTHRVAKVMISIPDDLLARLDAQARANRETRSGFLRRLVEREIAAEGVNRRKEFEALLGPPVDLGVDAATLIREDRESH